MTHTAAPQPSPRPSPGARAVDRRRSPGVFRGRLERRLPTTGLMVEADCLLPPVGRSEAFAEDLDDLGADNSSALRANATERPRLRWLGLPALALGVGATLGLASFSGVAGLVGF